MNRYDVSVLYLHQCDAPDPQDAIVQVIDMFQNSQGVENLSVVVTDMDTGDRKVYCTGNAEGE